MTWRSLIAQIAIEEGGMRRAAKRIGCDMQSLYVWMNGRKPQTSHRIAILCYMTVVWHDRKQIEWVRAQIPEHVIGREIGL